MSEAAEPDRALTGRPPQRFGVTDTDLGGAPALAVRGELDLSSMPALVTALDAAIRDTVGVFVIDLCDVEFLDSSALSALMHARALLGREDRVLAVVCPPGPVRRLFEVSGADALLVLYESRDALSAAIVPPD